MTKFKSFTTARKFARDLSLTNREQWRKFAKTSKKPDTIPASPDSVYSENWVSWSNWLGTDKKQASVTRKRSK